MSQRSDGRGIADFSIDGCINALEMVEDLARCDGSAFNVDCVATDVEVESALETHDERAMRVA